MSDKPIQSRSVSATLRNSTRPNLRRNAVNTAMSSAFPVWAGGIAQDISMQRVSNAAAFDKDLQLIKNRVNELTIPPSPASPSYLAAEKSLAEQLFDATANVKILTSQVAMHLDREWREKLFRQLDSMHDPAEWESGDEPVKQASFATFLKAIIRLKPQRRPGLGLSYGGNLIAAWTRDTDRLTIEFLPNDGVKWVIARRHGDVIVRTAELTVVSLLDEGLASYRPEHWFSE
jgi:hypothetical protein